VVPPGPCSPTERGSVVVELDLLPRVMPFGFWAEVPLAEEVDVPDGSN
jgi:hypothetical protein